MKRYMGADVDHLDGEMSKLGQLFEHERQGQANMVKEGR